jgi:hypothetical protein
MWKVKPQGWLVCEAPLNVGDQVSRWVSETPPSVEE